MTTLLDSAGTSTAPVSDAAPTATADTPAAAAPEAQATTTDTPAPETPPTADQTDWRRTFAGENADLLKTLERYTDPTKVAEALHHAQKALREQGRVKIPGEGATPEEIAAWNKARGVPETADGYQIKAAPPEGVEITPENKAILGTITERLHKAGADPATVNLAHELYYEQVAADQAARVAAAEKAQAECRAQLQSLWGSETDANLKVALQALVQFGGGKEGAESIASLELSDGSRLGDNAAFIKAMAQIGQQFREDPAFMLEPAASAASLKEQIDSIMKLRLTPEGMRQYNAPETQAKLQDLFAKQEAFEARATRAA